MSAPLDELYFKWLYALVADPKETNLSRSYWGLLRQLYTKEFVFIVPHDDNRLEDGKDLRFEFLASDKSHNNSDMWVTMGCSMFELLVGLSRRLSFQAEGEPAQWFWTLLDHIHLADYNDLHPRDDVDEILDEVIWRRYLPSGKGGLFPLERPKEDQRKVELWYQLSAYILERM